MELLKQFFDFLSDIAIQLGCILAIIYMYDGTRRLLKNGKSKEAKNTLIIGLSFSAIMIFISVFSLYFMNDISASLDDDMFKEKSSQNEMYASLYFVDSGNISEYVGSDGINTTYCPTQKEISNREDIVDINCKLGFVEARARNNILDWVITILIAVLFGWLASKEDFGKDIRLFKSKKNHD